MRLCEQLVISICSLVQQVLQEHKWDEVEAVHPSPIYAGKPPAHVTVVIWQSHERRLALPQNYL
jgi:hypothetical protein